MKTSAAAGGGARANRRRESGRRPGWLLGRSVMYAYERFAIHLFLLLTLLLALCELLVGHIRHLLVA